MIRCDQCDNRIIPGWSFCAYCGYPQTDSGLEDAQREISNRMQAEETIAKLSRDLGAAEEKLRLTNTGSLPLLYDIRRALGWNDKTSLSILADGVRRVRRALQTWDTPTGMDLEALAMAVKARVAELERINAENKTRIGELLEAAEPAQAE